MRLFVTGILMIGTALSVVADGVNTPATQIIEQPVVKVMTLNIAHGRGDGFNQLFQSTRHVKENLDAIAVVLNREQPAIVALQEVDAHSFWNGWFNHGQYLVDLTDLSHQFVGEHATNVLFKYGTGLISKESLLGRKSVSFRKNLFRPKKGFVVSTISWPANQDIDVDVVSVHLDFLSASIRLRQIDLLISVLTGHNNPLIVMGDFNSDLADGSGLFHRLAGELDLHTWQAGNNEPSTFPALNRRLDYVFVSEEFEFRTHKILIDAISDHRAVTADLLLTAT